MSITRQDLQAVIAGPHPGGIPLGADQLDRIAAVLNQHSARRAAPIPTDRHPAERTPLPVSEPSAGRAAADHTATASTAPTAPQPPDGSRPRQQVLDTMQRAGYRPEQIQEAKGLLTDTVDSQHDGAVVAKLGLTQGELMERMGASP